MTAKPFSEAALCAAFIAAATVTPKRTDHAQWVAYPETGGFDILLVRQTDGVQIGIEAKLALNPLVVSQVLPKRQEWTAGLVSLFHRFGVLGFAWDAHGRRYETLEDLHAYAVRVAGTVGAMMSLIMRVSLMPNAGS